MDPITAVTKLKSALNQLALSAYGATPEAGFMMVAS
jgi:hypothetical protein